MDQWKEGSTISGGKDHASKLTDFSDLDNRVMNFKILGNGVNSTHNQNIMRK